MPLDTRIPLMAQPIQMPDFNAMALQRQQQQQNAMAMQFQQEQISRARREEAAALASQTRRQQVGSMIGGGDYAGAEKAAAEGGDFDLIKTIQGLSAEQRKQAAERTDKLAAIAFAASDLPYEQRRGFIEAAASHIAGLGFTPEQLAEFDPTDENIGGIVASTQSLAEQLARSDKDRAFKLDNDKFEYGKANDEANRKVTMRGQDISAATQRRGQDISAATSRRGQDMTQSRATQGQTGPQGTRQQQGVARQKLNGLNAIEGQLRRVEQAMGEMEKKGYSGALLGYVPGRVDASSNTFDKSVAGLSPLIRQLTRVPGEGAMSDYEARLAEAVLPSRADTPEGRREALAAVKDLIRETRAGYQEFLGESQGQGGGVIRYDAKGNRIK